MINANELRPGNVIKYNTSGMLVRFSNHYGLCNIEKRPDAWDGVNLTTEILEKCGFIENRQFVSEQHPWSDYINDCVEITMPYFEFVFNNDYNTIEIKYLHQLQNLYFALTGKELDVSKLFQPEVKTAL